LGFEEDEELKTHTTDSILDYIIPPSSGNSLESILTAYRTLKYERDVLKELFGDFCDMTNLISKYQLLDEVHCKKFLTVGTDKDDTINNLIPKFVELYNKFKADVILINNFFSSINDFINPTSKIIIHTVFIPDELHTEKAIDMINKAIEANLMDNNYVWKGTRPQAAYFAVLASEKLKFKNRQKYKPFEKLWNLKNLAQEQWKTKEVYGTVREQQVIDNFFNSLDF
jgi:hypothetical protein